MKKDHFIEKISARDCIIIIFIFLLTLVLSMYNYALFHTSMELITIVIGFTIMLISLGTLKVCDNYFFSFLGILYGFVSILDLFHISTYHRILTFKDGIIISIRFRIAARIFESIALLFSIYYIKHKINLKKVLIINIITLFFIFYLILILKPLTKFDTQWLEVAKLKIYAEVIICLLLVFFIILLKKNSEAINLKEMNKFILAICFKIISEIFFIFYADYHSFNSYMAYFTKVISFYYFFRVMIKSVIMDPYSGLFQSLNSKAKELEDKNMELTIAKAKIEKDYLEYKRVIEILPDSIVIRECEKIVYVNDRFCKMLNIEDKTQIINKSMQEFIFESYHEKLSKRLYSLDKETLISPAEYKMVFNNKTIYVEISSIYTENISNKPCTISVIRDISDRKKAEEVELLLRGKEKEDIMKNEFFANISHELRTPISVIYSAIQLETNYIENLNVEQIAKYNGIITQNCLRLIRLINNIIDITRIETEFFKPEFSVQNIVTLIENITLSVISYAEYKKINVVFDTEYEELYVNCDANLVERIILNLLSNSVKNGNENGNIEVSIYKKNDSFISISVKDDGIGIPDDMQQKIFERFQKVDKSMSRNSEGSGIGLSLVKSLVEIQNGTISIKSMLNKGTEITIDFPSIDEEDEVCMAIEKNEMVEEKDITEKIKIEFSDLYR